MTSYILILFVGGFQFGGATTAEFSSLEACRNAMSVVEGRFGTFTLDVATVCVPKELEE